MAVDAASNERSNFAWGRVAAAIGLIVAIAAVVLARGFTVSGALSERTYNDATVVVDGQTFDAVACESEDNGIEVRYGTDGEAAYVRHMASGGTVVVLHSTAVELTSRSVTQLERASDDQLAFAAEFDGGQAMTVAYDFHSMGWCS